MTSHERLRALAALEPFELAAKLTLLALLLSPVGDWSIRPLVLILAVAGLLLPGGQPASGCY